MPQPQIDPQMYQDVMSAGEPDAGQSQQMQQGEPQLSPEQMAQLQAQMQMQQQPQMAQGMPTQSGVPPQDEVAEVQKMLGLDALQQQQEAMQMKMRELEMEKTKSLMSAKYPDIPFELVQKEIDKFKDINPDLAEAMLVDPNAMEMAYKATKAEIKPQEEPDKILEGEGGGAGEKDALEDKIKKGEADDFDLGRYITSSMQG